MIQVTQLSKRYGSRWALRDLNLEIPDGRFVALLGANGAGKTTLLRILATLLHPTSGHVTINGLELPQQAPTIRRTIGLVTHLPLLYGELTAEENLRFYARLYGIERPAARIDALLELTGLASRRSDLVRTFSRGMQQRLAIGRALLHQPPVLLLDEPYTGLDEEACRRLDGLLRQVTSQGHTILMASHDLLRSEALADRFDVLTRGAIAASCDKPSLPPGGATAFYRSVVEMG
ncbi:MAG TPA: heme ABC exporter ATP-binding protein CcmA [Longilinea sp.]|nr:heme ABC exporter ATP-binding protein CcmA [Longilinea sp.]